MLCALGRRSSTDPARVTLGLGLKQFACPRREAERSYGPAPSVASARDVVSLHLHEGLGNECEQVVALCRIVRLFEAGHGGSPYFARNQSTHDPSLMRRSGFACGMGSNRP